MHVFHARLKLYFMTAILFVRLIWMAIVNSLTDMPSPDFNHLYDATIL